MLKQAQFRLVMEGIRKRLFPCAADNDVRHIMDAGCGGQNLELRSVTLPAELNGTQALLSFFAINSDFLVADDRWVMLVTCDNGEQCVHVSIDETVVSWKQPQMMCANWYTSVSAQKALRSLFHEALECPSCVFPTFTKEAVRASIRDDATFRDWLPSEEEKWAARRRALLHSHADTGVAVSTQCNTLAGEDPRGGEENEINMDLDDDGESGSSDDESVNVPSKTTDCEGAASGGSDNESANAQSNTTEAAVRVSPVEMFEDARRIHAEDLAAELENVAGI